MEKTSTHTHHLSSINVLFTDSWEMFKGSVLNVFILAIISLVVCIAVFIVGILLSLPFGAVAVFSAITSQKITPEFFSSLAGIGVVAVIFLIVTTLIGFAFQAATVMVVANYKQKPEAVKSLKQSIPFMLPLFLASIVSGFVLSGGFFLFIIPGIFFSVLFYFVVFEIVLNNKGVLASFRRSSGIVLANFWGIFGRVALWVGIVIAISLIPQIAVSSTESSELASLWSIASFFINIFISWYGISYAVTLYKQAEKAAPEGKHGKLLWPVITAVVGWIVGILVIVGIVYAIINIVVPQIQKMGQAQENLKRIEQMQQNENATPEDFLNLFPTGSAERAQLQKQIEEEMQNNDSMMYVSVTPTQ